MVNAPERSLGGRRLAGNRTSRSVWSARVFHRSFPRARLWGVEGPSRSSYDSHRATTISLLLESREAFGVRVYPTALFPRPGARLWGVEGPSHSSYDSHGATTISLLLESREAFGVRVYPTALPPERGCGG